MGTKNELIFMPVFAMVLLTIIVLLGMYLARKKVVRERRVRLGSFKTSRDRAELPGDVIKY